jgi:hypothetical protein
MSSHQALKSKLKTCTPGLLHGGLSGHVVASNVPLEPGASSKSGNLGILAIFDGFLDRLMY